MLTSFLFCQRGLCILWLLCAIALCGCESTNATGGKSLASIEVQGHTPLEIARAVSETFKRDGFQAIPLPRNDDLRMQFEKQGSTGSSVLYSDWSFKPIWYRARVQLLKTEEDTYVVTCNAFRVNERGDPHFEEEHKVLQKGHYQDLLDKAKAKLSAGNSN